MSINVNELNAPRGDSWKPTQLGDKIAGTVAYVGEWEERINKFNDRLEHVMRIVLDGDDGSPVALWPVKGSVLAQAIADAVRAAGATTFDVGGRLGVQLAEFRDTGKGNPLKVYAAQYKPPAATVGRPVNDLI